MSYMQTPQPGISVKCVDDNVFVWQVKLSEFPPESQIHKDLKQLQSIYNYSYVEVEIRFMMDLYPFFPPSVRLVRPRMKVRHRRLSAPAIERRDQLCCARVHKAHCCFHVLLCGCSLIRTS